ncbi:hypothetical protein GYO_1692 [Bacillus spizizenii TU-B-10]|uniref:Uncharacterized protein n=1 Tax=Bacillus spizizenii (strain DSM 15029 / JCM 12233 / NBRC 101239 / NRRL B-23049 / TU-B-10) TaxID=1052585 RepID=G4NVH8_BACS4|nr:hypothetical protein GYO_1692 [Bacillus spizizenii TU-B-10]
MKLIDHFSNENRQFFHQFPLSYEFFQKKRALLKSSLFIYAFDSAAIYLHHMLA